MSDLFAVSSYLDQIKRKKKKEYFFNKPDMPKCLYFDTEAEAKQFIVNRAGEQVVKARKVLARAEKRYTKCLGKFGTVADVI